MPRYVKDWTGQRFGYLTAIRDIGTTGKQRIWLLACDCGKTKTLIGKEVGKLRATSSCGCRRLEVLRIARTRHGMSRHPVFHVWRSMCDRCRLPTHQAWHNYGGRGITVCPAWSDSFTQFWTDMGPTYVRGLTLERIDNSQGYSPENCRWATPKEQARNTRRSRLIDTPWGRMTVAEAAERSGIGVTTLHYRIKVRAPSSTMFSTPDTSTDLPSRA